MPAEIRLRLATRQDREIVAAILEEARAWLAERRIDQWNRPFDDVWIEPKLDAGEFFIADRNGDTVGVVRLLDEDRLFWGDRDRGDSLYIHSLATRRDLAGQHLGAQILTEIAALAHARNRSTLRLDCVAANPRLIAYYAAHGFTPIDTIPLGGFEMVLMEQEVRRENEKTPLTSHSSLLTSPSSAILSSACGLLSAACCKRTALDEPCSLPT